jgi:hypothetical protein
MRDQSKLLPNPRDLLKCEGVEASLVSAIERQLKRPILSLTDHRTTPDHVQTHVPQSFRRILSN